MQITIYMHGTPFDPFILRCCNDAGPVNDIHVSSPVGR